ncbi:hypothetical protein Bbelb_195990 [Branchiostoma belcheri]|nr:hypothetical protein Bbelb_195990 [Branchiostoma belcheri]
MGCAGDAHGRTGPTLPVPTSRPRQADDSHACVLSSPVVSSPCSIRKEPAYHLGYMVVVGRGRYSDMTSKCPPADDTRGKNPAARHHAGISPCGVYVSQRSGWVVVPADTPNTAGCFEPVAAVFEVPAWRKSGLG